MNPESPVYIVSKNRWQDERRLTAKALDAMRVPFRVIVEESQRDLYARAVGEERILVLPKRYFDEYDPLTDVPHISNGPGPARNFAWDHSVEAGFSHHWVMDDNISSFRRMNRNRQIAVSSGTALKAMEDFTLRYENVAISGPQYDFFVPSKYRFPPFVANTRIYSCLFIRNDIPYRWRGRYNEDTDLCLRVLKDGYCTIQFNAFLQEKKETQGLRGGNTDDFYSTEGTLAKSQMLVDTHPDVARLIWKYGRWHHYVDYRKFADNELRYRPGYVPERDTNEYGMRMVYRETGQPVEAL